MIDGLDAALYYTSPNRRYDMDKPISDEADEVAVIVTPQRLSNRHIRMLEEIWSVYYGEDA